VVKSGHAVYQSTQNFTLISILKKINKMSPNQPEPSSTSNTSPSVSLCLIVKQTELLPYTNEGLEVCKVKQTEGSTCQSVKNMNVDFTIVVILTLEHFPDHHLTHNFTHLYGGVEDSSIREEECWSRR
jgi:hypothetical protein